MGGDLSLRWVCRWLLGVEKEGNLLNWIIGETVLAGKMVRAETEVLGKE